jgi:peptidylprolyl isomerase
MLKRILLCIVAVFAALSWLFAQERIEGLSEGLYAELDTSRGMILLSLEYKRVPMTVTNFVGLSEGSIDFENRGASRFYDGLVFHRVIEDFMIQGGDPLGNGRGGPGYTFPDEIHSELRHDGPGTLSMANSGPNSNGSQFFITHKATPWLDGKHTVFGRVVRGQDVVNAIQQGDRIRRVRIIRVGGEADAFVVNQSSFDRLVREAWESVEAEQARKRETDLAFIRNKWPDARQTKSGLLFIILKEGSGPSPKTGQRVTVHYTGQLLDGTVFDSSRKRGEPAVFPVGRLIPGWNEALLSMKRGERRLLVIPPELGYGKQGYPGVIPPESFLVFDMELIDF